MNGQPTGTVTILFTDIEGSTALWEHHPDTMQRAVARHDALVREAIAAHGGHVVKITGDGFHAVFATAPGAFQAALAAQRALATAAWGDAVIKVRMGLHTGATDERAGDYYGPAVNRAARVMSAGHGGQILLSQATRELIRDQLPAYVELRDLGQHRLRNLTRPEHIFQVVAPDLPADFPPLQTLGYRPHNLPAQTTSFIGRETELAAVRQALLRPEVRLLTLTGPGGTGKTRLGLQAAAAMLDDFDHGVFFVALAPLAAGEQVAPVVAQALDVDVMEGQSVQDRLNEYLRAKQILLVLDNFEQATDAAPAVIEWLTLAPRLKVLATSRASLRVAGEHSYAVPPLPVPPDPTQPLAPEQQMQYPAMRLFVERAGAQRAGFALTKENVTPVAQICRRLEGLPLAIELAAAWVKVLTPDEILAELDQSLDFLETDAQDVPERHRSLQAVFDYSWRLLTERERAVFQELAVFRGSFTRAAAQQVTGASLRELMALANKSLLYRTPADHYRVHELLRRYAEDRLAQSPAASAAARDRHCAYYAAAVQKWEADFRGPGRRTALEEMDVEHENVRAAWSWAVEQGLVERLDQALVGLCRFYRWQGRHQEGQAACRLVTEMTSRAAMMRDDGLRVLARALMWQGTFTQWVGHSEQAGQLLQQSLALLQSPELIDQDTRPEQAFIWCHMGDIAFDSDRQAAQQLYEQGLAVLRALDDRWGMVHALQALGSLALVSGNYDQAQSLYEESLVLCRALDDSLGIAYALRSLGMLALHWGHFEEAERLAWESQAFIQETGNRVRLASGLYQVGQTLLAVGQFTEARSLLEEARSLYDDLGYPVGQAFASVALGDTDLHLGRYERAYSVVQAGLDLAREVNNRRGLGHALRVLGNAALAEAAYAKAQRWLQESVAVYRQIGQREELGWALATLGCATRSLGQAHQAASYHFEALQTAVSIQSVTASIRVLPAIALFLADRREPERAVELYALAARYPFVANSRWFEDVAGRHIAAVAATLPSEVVTVAQERGRGRDLHATVRELLVELAAGKVDSAAESPPRTDPSTQTLDE